MVLLFNDAQAADAGGYTVVVTNSVGSVTSTVATLTVVVPPDLSSPLSLGTNGFQFAVNGTAGVNYVIQASTNLAVSNWVSLFTNAPPFLFVDPQTSNSLRRFYRAVYFP